MSQALNNVHVAPWADATAITYFVLSSTQTTLTARREEDLNNSDNKPV
jgi:hypothetical protein